VTFTAPPYPYDRLNVLADAVRSAGRQVIDLSIGTPCDPPPRFVLDAMAGSNAERGYPPSIGTTAFRSAAAAWIERRFGCSIDPTTQLAACVGTKEFVAGLPLLLRLAAPERDVVLHPAVAYPTYAMGALLAGCEPVAVPLNDAGQLDLGSIDPDHVRRALCCWVNRPANPGGALTDLGGVSAWGRAHGVPVCSDECYTEFAWTGPVAADGRPGSTILEHGTDGVLAVHSLSKRSNLAGVRVGCYAGDERVVGRIAELRKHQGLMVSGPAQAGAVAAWNDDVHVVEQRERYEGRLDRLAAAFTAAGHPVAVPAGAFYLWVPVGVDDAWDMTRRLALGTGVIVSPGEFYGDAGADHLRVAVVRSDEMIDRAAELVSAGEW